jgi:hypothetical protein
MNDITKTERKYLEALKYLKQKLDNNEYISLSDWIKESSITTRISTILIKNKIIKNKSSKPFPQYEWISISPNIKMVRAIMDSARNTQYKPLEKRKRILKHLENQQKPTTQGTRAKMKKKVVIAKQRNETVRVEPRMHPKLEQKTQKSIVIFWGLINIKF